MEEDHHTGDGDDARWMKAAEVVVNVISEARDKRMSELKEDAFFQKLSAIGQGQRLKPHQVYGVLWMSAMYDCGCSCILGDEMGMGKTVQTICTILRLAQTDPEHPVLVVTPLAVLKGWEEEFRRWSKGFALNLVFYHPSFFTGGIIPSSQRKKRAMHDTQPSTSSNSSSRGVMTETLLDIWRRQIPEPAAGSAAPLTVVVTTPGILISDFEVINAHGGRWGLVVVDEAHNAKNSATAFSRHLQMLDTESLFLLTGSIVQNNVEEELLHLLSFVVPPMAKEILSHCISLKRKEGGLFVGTRPTATLETIAHILYCFMLRRLIQDTPGIVMPSKISCTVYVAQTPLQKQLYEGLLKDQTFFKELCDKHPFLAITSAALAKAPSHMRERPLHTTDEASQTIMCAAIQTSNKMAFLMHILPSLMHDQPQHKIILFSNSLGVLHLLGIILHSNGYAIDLITGEMSDIEERKARVDRFNSAEQRPLPSIMLLSTKAMGQGVQLTGADTVIFFDHHDNPQNDNQAEARAYRITQTKPVLVLRLVTRDTKEEEAMNSWVKRKREVQQWLEITRVMGHSASSTRVSSSPPQRQRLELGNEATLQSLLLERSPDKAGQWEANWLLP